MTDSKSFPNITILPDQSPEVEKVKLEYYIPKFAKPTGQRIAFIVEHPLPNDFKKGQWLTGDPGDLIFNQLKHYGVERQDCFFGGLIRYAPDHASDSCVGKTHEMENRALREALLEFKPNLVVLVGDKALKASMFLEGKKKNTNDAFIGDWRGSLFISRKPIFDSFKCLPIEHPSDVFIAWADKWPLFACDIKKVNQNSYEPDLRLTKRQFHINLTVDEIIVRLRNLLNEEEVAMDIEGYVDNMSCVSYSPNKAEAFVIPWNAISDYDRIRLLPHIGRFHASRVKKVLQNSQYDNFVFAWTYKSFIRHVRIDTMVAAWELNPELPRGLATQLSLWTDIPYYKFARESESLTERLEYNALDSCGTKELADYYKRQFEVKPESYRHFGFNMALLPVIMYLELRGIHYWQSKAKEHWTATTQELTSLQKRMELIVNKERSDMLKAAKENTSLVPANLPPYQDFNPASSKQVMDYLYFGRPRYAKQYSKPTKAKPTPTLTADTPALLELVKTYNSPDDEILELLLRYRHLEERRKALEWECDKDMRMRATYDCCGTVTGRFSCKKSPMNTGANLQTATKKLRHLFRADGSCWFWNVDLSGADGWTVAAHSMALGDPTMYEDYTYGLKPAKLIALMYLHGDISQYTRAELKEMSKSVTEEGEMGWLYFTAKRVQHGTNYGLGLDTMASTILKDSHKLYGKAIVVNKADCKKLKGYYLSRYPGVEKWQQQCKLQLQTTGRLRMCNGHERRFFGRKTDHATFREFLSTEPQANTTYATNKASLRLWTDPENRINLNPLGYVMPPHRRRVPFHVEPLHQVHDALNGQFDKSITEWAVKKIRSWFQNTIEIAGIKMVIPFDGAYGPSWGELGPEYGGGRI